MVKNKDSEVYIYLVDDDELLNKILLTKFQQNTKHKVFTFTSGEDFIKYYQSLHIKKPNKNIHILLIDYMLNPGVPVHSAKTGIDFIKEARAINPQINTILISAIDNPELSILAQKEGVNAFIKKNENAFLRINNQISFIISEIKLQKAHKRSLTTRKIFVAILIMFSLLIVYIALTEFILN
ncbi:MAG: response regulator [Bacteroidales bacterium]|nr:response regulator [Bacteroidales bacterium]